MAHPSTPASRSNNDEKPGYEFSELAHTVLVPALPRGIKRNAGSVLDTKGLGNAEDTIKLAADGHVS
jgi:hypothetical protein